MKANPYAWPLWVVGTAIVIAGLVGYAGQELLGTFWGNAIGVAAGLSVTILGVTLADRSMTRKREGDTEDKATARKS